MSNVHAINQRTKGGGCRCGAIEFAVTASPSSASPVTVRVPATVGIDLIAGLATARIWEAEFETIDQLEAVFETAYS